MDQVKLSTQVAGPPKNLATPAFPKPTSKPSKLKSTSRIPTAISEVKPVRSGEEKESAPKPEETKETYGQEPFDFEKLKSVWKTFAEQKKTEGKDAEYAVLKQEFKLKDKCTIVLTLTNSVKINILDRFRSDLITYLKTELDNGSLELETELIEEDVKRVPYTNKEKFEHLAQKKPILNELKKRLGLDPDF